jgi:rhamnosyltransferase
MRISVVIRARNEEKYIDRLLYGITQQTVKNVEIILVDSGSTDNTLAIASQYPVNVVHIQPENFTFGRSLNMGIDASSGEAIVIISAHCYPVYPDWLEQLVKPLENEDVAISYGKQRGGSTNHFSEHQFFSKYFPENSVLQQGHPYSHNANAAIKKHLWKQNPYNENLTGLEDLAWSSWAMESGYTIAYVAEAEIIHLHDETASQVFNRYKREAVAMKQILPNSKFSLLKFIKFWLKNTLSDMNQARHKRSLAKNWWPIIWFRFMQFWGTYRGFHYSGKIDAQLHRAFYYPPDILDKKLPKQRSIKPIYYDQ